jgi:hypothetical protein
VSEFSRLAAADRAQYVEEAAARRGVSPRVVEKDAWVSWVLRELFSGPLLSSQMRSSRAAPACPRSMG